MHGPLVPLKFVLNILLDDADLVSKVSGDAVDSLLSVSQLIIPFASGDTYFMTRSFVIVPVPLPQSPVYDLHLSPPTSPNRSPAVLYAGAALIKHQ